MNFKYDKWSLIIGTFLTVTGIIVGVTNHEIRCMVGLERETKPCPLVTQEGTPLSPTLGASPNPAISFITLPDGTWYEGQIINGKPNGLGVAAYPNGDYYQGEFIDGKKHGKGLCIYATGYRYKGEYRNNQPNGRGVMLFPNGMRQEGIWVNGTWIGS